MFRSSAPVANWRPWSFSRLRLAVPVRSATVGIDLGTSNSAVAAVVDGKPTVIPLDNGGLTMPSAVTFIKDKDPLVGVESTTAGEAANTVYEVKRLIGQNFANVMEETENLAYEVVEASDGCAHVFAPAIESPVAPEYVSSMILKKLIDRAEEYLGEAVDKVVITVPAFFNARRKGATITAAGMAGLENVALIQEPVAAALAYGLGRPMDQDTILVLDMGGGTYDVSILESFEGMLEVVSTAGDSYLGGSDFDRKIVNWAAEASLSNGGPDPRLDPVDLRSLLDSAENAKMCLAEDGRVDVSFAAGGTSRTTSLDNELFSKITHDLEDRLWPPLQRAGEEAMIDWVERPTSNANSSASTSQPTIPDPWTPPPRRITKVVLAGGSSQLPVVKHLVSQVTGIGDLRCPVDPKLCVALGAAVFGAMMEGGVGNMELMDGSYASGMHDRVSGFQILTNDR